MASKKITGKTKAKLVVPQDRAEAEDWIRQIGEQRREVIRIEAAMNDELAVVKAGFEDQATPYREDIEALVEGVQAWAVANRDKLTQNGKRQSAELGTGSITWRQLPPKVTLRKVSNVIENLKKLGLTRFLRTKEEVNKDAMLAEPDAARLVPGVSIGSAGETFTVEPFEAELAEECCNGC